MEQRHVALTVDGNSLAHRAFHAYGQQRLTDSRGRPQEVCYGFTRMLAALCGKVRDRHGRLDTVVVGFDSPRNRRREADPGYKASRPSTDDSLLGQMDRLQRLLWSMGVRHVVADGWEADDVCASAATEARAAGWRAVVATSDRDALALVADTVELLQVRNGMDQARFLGPDEVAELFGVHPSRYPLMAALRGDPSDDLPGVPGLGPKKAAALAAAYPDLASMLADGDGVRAVVGPSAASKLAEFRRGVERNLVLMTLNRQLSTGVLTAVLPPMERVLTALGDAQLPELQRSCADRLSAGGDAPTLFDEPAVTVRRPVA